MKKFFHSISTMMLLVALTGMGLASCSESPEAPEDPTENPDDEDKGDGSEGEGGDENKTVELNYTVAEAAYWGDDYMEDGTSNLIVYLYDSPRDEDGVHTGPKDHFNIDMNLPNFNGGELLIPARSYPIGEPEVYAPNTLEPGFADEFEIGGVLYGDYYGVFHQVIDAEQNETYEMVSEGEMTVGYENGVYTIDATFTASSTTSPTKEPLPSTTNRSANRTMKIGTVRSPTTSRWTPLRRDSSIIWGPTISRRSSAFCSEPKALPFRTAPARAN